MSVRSVCDDVSARLAALGYDTDASETERAMIRYCIDRATEHILININCAEIPQGLYFTLVDMATGLFLKDKKDTNQLGDNFDFSAPVKSISEGDVTVTFAGAADGSSTAEARFDALLERLINPPQSVYAAFRRMKW